MFISGVETTMGWRAFVELGEEKKEPWGVEIRRLRQALKNRTGSSTLKFVKLQATTEGGEEA